MHRHCARFLSALLCWHAWFWPQTSQVFPVLSSSASEKACVSEIVPKYLGSCCRLERLGRSPCDLRQGVELRGSSGRSFFSRGEEASGGMRRVSWSGMSEHTVCQQANGSIPLFPVENISITMFLFIDIFHPWHNNEWILPWKSQFPLHAPCSFSRHFPTKGSGISAVSACAPDEFYLE